VRLRRYPTLSFEEIYALPVAEMATPIAHLYLWCPNALLAEGMQTLARWGFTYKTNIVWYKIRRDGGPDRRGVGFYFRNVTELLLFGVRGSGSSVRTLAAGRRQPALVRGERPMGVGEEIGEDEREERDVAERLGPCHEELDAPGAAVARGVDPRGRDGVRIHVESHDEAGAQLGGGDGENARAGADVEDAVGPRVGDGLVEERQAALGAAVVSRAEGAPRLDHDRDSARSVGRFPRRLDPESPPNGPRRK
jgi:N6-adenosine-specific RNA methylase IME4